MSPVNSIQLCVFQLGEFWMAFDVTDIQELVLQQDLTPVPLAGDLICGLMNLRGNVVMVMDLRRRFGLPDRDSDRLATNVLHKKSHGIVSFLVDEVEGVLTLQEDQIAPPPAIIRGVSRDLVRGTVQLPNRLLLVLDGTKCADVSDFVTPVPAKTL